MNFEILRHMETFTRDMFDNIIAFQEKQHPAWNPQLPFGERIRHLPLHYLMFSNGDRNPQTHGPTVSHYYPLRREMVTIANYAKQVAAQPVVLDVHARNGFIGSLLSREGVKVVGLKDPADKPNQIESFYDPNGFAWSEKSLSDVDQNVDVLFSSWMPPRHDITDAVVRIQPKLVVYIYTDHVNPNNGERQTGRDNAFGEHLPDTFKLLTSWSVTRPSNILHDVWPDLTGNIEETRHVRIYANKGYHNIPDVSALTVVPSYDWESDLIMAETALAAKNAIRQRGFPVNGF